MPMDAKTIYQYVGSLEQVSGIKDYTFNEGKAKNVRALEMYASDGLSMTVLPDRGMDISALSFKGTNVSFLSKTGVVGSHYFVEQESRGFMKNFFGGFLTTGGLSYMGAPCHDEGQSLGLHGTISNTPAYNVSYTSEYTDKLTLSVSGKIKEAQVFGPHLVMTRNIHYDENTGTICLEDTIKNYGFTKSPVMVLYHFNFGYPFLSPSLEIDIPSNQVLAREKETIIEDHVNMTPPDMNKVEDVFFHEVTPDAEGKVEITLKNQELGLGMLMTYNAEDLPYLTQWKSMASGEYALGIEPGTYNVMGRDHARKSGKLLYLEAMEEKKITITIKLHTL